MHGGCFSFPAVQEERQRAKERGEVEVESTTSANSEMPVEMILDAEMAVENQLDIYMDNPNDISGSLGMAAEKQMYSLVDWAKRIPHFTELSLDDQIILLKTGQYAYLFNCRQYSFIHSGNLYSASSRGYYSEALPAQSRPKKDFRGM